MASPEVFSAPARGFTRGAATAAAAAAKPRTDQGTQEASPNCKMADERTSDPAAARRPSTRAVPAMARATPKRKAVSLDIWGSSNGENKVEDEVYEYLTAAERQVYASTRQRVFSPPDEGLAVAAQIFDTNDGHSASIGAILLHWKQRYGRTEASASIMAMAYFAVRGYPVIVKKLLDGYMNHFGYPEKAQVFAPLLYANAVRHHLPRVLDLFDRISSVFGLQPDLPCWNALLRAYCEMDDVDGASKCFAQIQETGLALDSSTLEPLMLLCARRGDTAGSLSYFGIVEELGIRKTAPMYEALVLALVQQGDIELAERAALQFLSEQVGGSLTRMWNEVIMGYSRRRRIDHVMRIYHYMPSADIARNDQTYTNVLMALVETCRPRYARWFFDVMMPRAGIQPDALHFALLMRAYRTNKAPRRAIEVYNLMRRRGIEPTARTEIELLKASEKIKHETRDHRGRTCREYGLRPARHLVQNILERRDPRFRRPDDLLAWERPQVFRRIYPQAFEELLTNAYGRWRRAQPTGASTEALASEYSLNAAYRNLSQRDHRGGAIRLSRLRLLAGLMVGLRKQCAWPAIDRAWRTALAEAATRARTMQGGTHSNPRWVAQGRRYLLAPLLAPYLEALADQGRVDDIRNEVHRLIEAGYELDPGNWNTYVRVLAMTRQYVEAFSLCERKLMPGWTGWAPLRQMYGLPTDAPPERANHDRLIPTVKTLRILAHASQLIAYETRGGIISPQMMPMILDTCPRTLMAIRTMPYEVHRRFIGGSFGEVSESAKRSLQQAMDVNWLWTGQGRYEREKRLEAMMAGPVEDIPEDPSSADDGPFHASQRDGGEREYQANEEEQRGFAADPSLATDAPFDGSLQDGKERDNQQDIENQGKLIEDHPLTNNEAY
ncbi:MAG: RNA polymerase C-22 sterol desaturase [Watsoniomyces obsoletus]|nr:MAG: RNA polymerase C-22 sterol desaturase [Watsoniomyces obsoletus]